MHTSLLCEICHCKRCWCMKEGSAQQVLYNSALTLMTFTLTTWNLDVYNELELRPTLHILFRDSYLHWTVVVNSQYNHFYSHTNTDVWKLQINSKLNMFRNVALGETLILKSLSLSPKVRQQFVNRGKKRCFDYRPVPWVCDHCSQRSSRQGWWEKVQSASHRLFSSHKHFSHLHLPTCCI